jgi:selenocysteine lyase/cysteine desulfurase
MAKQKSRSCYKSLRALFTRRRNKTKEDGDGERIHGCGSDTCDDHTLADNEPTKTIDPSVHYFNNAAQAPLSQAVQKLGVELIRADPWSPIDDNHSGPYSQAQIRNLFATLIDCEDDENEDNPGSRIAMVPSTAFAVTLAARNILACRRKQQNNFAIGGGGGRILLLQDQFDSAVYPWQQVCDESNGAVALEIVGHPDDEDTNDGDGGDGPSGWTKAVLDTLEGSADDEIIAACLPPLHWSNGTLLDLEAIGAVCRERNIPLIVDATQGA